MGRLWVDQPERHSETLHTRDGEAVTVRADTSSFEFGLSIDDRRQGHGIGAALLKNLERRAAALGAMRMFGDTLRSNEAMMSLARSSGFSFTRHPDDWKLARFEKRIGYGPRDIPCASWRLAAQARGAPS